MTLQLHMQLVISFVSSEMMRCRLLPWSLDHPMNARVSIIIIIITIIAIIVIIIIIIISSSSSRVIIV